MSRHCALRQYLPKVGKVDIYKAGASPHWPAQVYRVKYTTVGT